MTSLLNITAYFVMYFYSYYEYNSRAKTDRLLVAARSLYDPDPDFIGRYYQADRFRAFDHRMGYPYGLTAPN